jgi:hypothetical protein
MMVIGRIMCNWREKSFCQGRGGKVGFRIKNLLYQRDSFILSIKLQGMNRFCEFGGPAGQAGDQGYQ